MISWTVVLDTHINLGAHRGAIKIVLYLVSIETRVDARVANGTKLLFDCYYYFGTFSKNLIVGNACFRTNIYFPFFSYVVIRKCLLSLCLIYIWDNR